jgi:hypothetical protein
MFIFSNCSNDIDYVDIVSIPGMTLNRLLKESPILLVFGFLVFTGIINALICFLSGNWREWIPGRYTQEINEARQLVRSKKAAALAKIRSEKDVAHDKRQRLRQMNQLNHQKAPFINRIFLFNCARCNATLNYLRFGDNFQCSSCNRDTDTFIAYLIMIPFGIVVLGLVLFFFIFVVGYFVT